MAGELLLDWRKARGQGSALFNLVAPIQYLLVTAWFNVFPLPQAANFRKSFAHAARAMDAGFHVLVFPEGRRTPDGLLHPFQGGTGMLWRELRTPVLPVYLGGMEKRGWFHSGRVSIHVGKPIPFNPDLDATEATRLLEQTIREM
jgi:long-chain acyl-CoA synthetase